MNQQTNIEIPIVLAGRYKIKPEKRERFLELTKLALEYSRAESGNISYGCYEEVGSLNSFIYFEEWKSREALAKHLKQAYVTPLLEEFPELVDGEADVRVYDIHNFTYGL